MMETAFRDYDEAPEWRYDYDFAPIKPRDFDYRQTYANALSDWLRLWMPRPESVQ